MARGLANCRRALSMAGLSVVAAAQQITDQGADTKGNTDVA